MTFEETSLRLTLDKAVFERTVFAHDVTLEVKQTEFVKKDDKTYVYTITVK